MDNSSNCTTPQSDTTGFLGFSIVIMLTAGGAIFFNILTAVVASTRKELHLPLRILLVNLLVGSTLTAVALVLQSTVSVLLLSREFNVCVVLSEQCCCETMQRGGLLHWHIDSGDKGEKRAKVSPHATSNSHCMALCFGGIFLSGHSGSIRIGIHWTRMCMVHN